MTRPKDVWRVCGKPVTVPADLNKKGRGCDCTGRELRGRKSVAAGRKRLGKKGS